MENMEKGTMSLPSEDIQKDTARPGLWPVGHGQTSCSAGLTGGRVPRCGASQQAAGAAAALRSVAMLVLLSLALPAARGAEFSGIAFVNDDGTLRVRHRTVQLYGILIPSTEETCYFFQRPAPCGPRTALALKFNIGTDFVHCSTRSRNADGSYVAVCTADDEDLAAQLLSQGWAVALPDAPFEYQALEKIARSRGIGVWGLAVEPGRGPIRIERHGGPESKR
jgi:endonuclease YncB( thermonuclease family)